MIGSITLYCWPPSLVNRFVYFYVLNAYVSKFLQLPVTKFASQHRIRLRQGGEQLRLGQDG